MKQQRRNPKSANFGLGNRCMDRAAKNALAEGINGFSTKNTHHDRWVIFSRWLQTNYGISDMRKITKDHLIAYGKYLLNRVSSEQLQQSTAQNYLSSINTILSIARGDNFVRVRPVTDCKIPKRSGVCKTNKATSISGHKKALETLSLLLSTTLEIERVFGLRFEESAKLNAKKAFKQALSNQEILITEGTKGGRPRKVPIQKTQQIEVLEKAACLQQGQSMIPPDQTYKEFRDKAYQAMGDLPVNFHGERHHYAQARYLEITGADCPIRSGIKKGKVFYTRMAIKLSISIDAAKKLDKEARKIISQELGHSRTNITNAYLG